MLSNLLITIFQILNKNFYSKNLKCVKIHRLLQIQNYNFQFRLIFIFSRIVNCDWWIRLHNKRTAAENGHVPDSVHIHSATLKILYFQWIIKNTHWKRSLKTKILFFIVHQSSEMPVIYYSVRNLIKIRWL